MKNFKNLKIILAIALFAWMNQGGFVSAATGTVTGSAWSDQIGWINFGTTNSNVQLSDTTLTGYAWNENAGWINLNPTNGGVLNDGTGALHGRAWSEGVGWINFSGVIVSYTNGVFSGTATGDNSVSINFSCSNCNVSSDWRPANVSVGGMTSGSVQTAVSPPPAPPPTIIEKIQEKIAEVIKPLIPKIFLPAEEPPKPVATIPKPAPEAMTSKWNLLAEKPLAKFVLDPLPKDIKMLAENFPEIGKTFEQLGISKASDLAKIVGQSFKLPGFGVPVANLSSTAKARIPADFVFLKGGGGLVDYNVALSINNKGQTTQKIQTLANSSLELVIRPDKPVKKVRGYIIFKSKKKSLQPSLQVPLEYLAASLVLPNPNLIEPKEDFEQRLVLAEFDYVDAGSGVYTATVQAPVVEGEYEIITVMDYEDTQLESKEIKLITVVDPEGYVYEKRGDMETRIAGSVVSLYWLNPSAGSGQAPRYELWPAKNFQQENPQTTDVRGTYSFLVPEGYYYLKVDAPGYISYDGKPFEVKEGRGVHVNIEMKTNFWFLNIVDWKTVLLLIVVLMLLYNFYKDHVFRKYNTAK